MSVIAAALRELMAAGLSGEDLVGAIARIEEAHKPVRSSGAERQARYRKRKEQDSDNESVTSVTSVTNVTSDASSPPCPPPFPPDPHNPPLNPPHLGGATNRGKRISADWQPTEEGRELAKSLGVDPEAEIEKFRDHWQAKSGRDAAKRDWEAMWRNWVKRAAEFNPTGKSPPKEPGLPDTDWAARLWDRRKGRCWMPGDFWPPGWGDDPTKNKTIPRAIHDKWRAEFEARKGVAA